MFGEHITMGEAVTVCLFSIVVVFLVLLSISYIIDITAWIVRKFSKTPAAKAAPAAVAAASAPVPAKRDDTADAVLVAAAVAAYLGTSTENFVVRSIRRVTSTETLWSQTGKTGSIQ